MGVARKIVEQFRTHGGRNGDLIVAEALKEGRFTPERINPMELAEACWGERWRERLARYGHSREWVTVSESMDSVTPDIFGATINRVVMDSVRRGYDRAVNISDSLVEVVPNPIGNLGPVRQRGPNVITSPPAKILPGMPYPKTGMEASWYDIPEPVKQGLICYVAEETMMTGDMATVKKDSEAVGKYVGDWVETERLSVIMGIKGNYSRNDVTMNTYISGTSGLYQNYYNNLEFIDWLTLDTVEQYFYKHLDPQTRRPINITPTQILSVRAMKAKIGFTLTQSQANYVPASSAAGYEMEGKSQAGNYQWFGSPWVDRLAAYASLTAPTTHWWVGNFKEAFKWREVYPLQTFTANASATDLTPSGPMGERDIVFGAKARVYGNCYVEDPFQVMHLSKES